MTGKTLKTEHSWISGTTEELFRDQPGVVYFTQISYQNREKTLYTVADSPEEASQKFHRHLICQWVGYPFDGPETLLEGVFDKIEDGALV